MKFENYPEYITSGFDWICEFPKEWTIRKVKSLCSQIGSGTTPDTSNDGFYENGTINFLQTGDLTDGYIVNTVKKINDKALNEVSALKIYPSNSLVIAMYGATIGKLGILNIDTTTNQACCVLNVSQELDSKFAFYSFLSARNYLISLSQGGSQPNIKQETIKSLRIPTPKISEQKNIVSFLDVETAKIDNLISKQEQLIQLLEEQRKSIISHAVTKGLNPDAPMKDSGVEWLGEIPTHWVVVRFSTIFTENKRKNIGMIESNVLSLSYGNIKEKHIETNKGLLPESFETYQIVEPNDIIFRFTDLQNDKKSLRNGISKFHGIITSAYVNVKTDENSDFYNYLFRSYDLKKVFYSMGDGMRQSLKISELNLMPIVLPPKDEQEAIVQYIESESKTILNLINKQTHLIEKLKEYRSSIISHAVTGKIDVREAL